MKNLKRADILMLESQEPSRTPDEAAHLAERAEALELVTWHRALTSVAQTSADPRERAAAEHALSYRNVEYCPTCQAVRGCDVTDGRLWCAVCHRPVTP